MQKKKPIILVAVRLKSKRLKEKAILILHDKPLIVKLVERLNKSKETSDIILCTSINKQDDIIYDLSKEFNIKCYRGNELDVMSRFIEIAQKQNIKTLIRVTGDNPLTDPLIMDEMIKSHVLNKSEYTYSEDIPHGTRSEVIETSLLIKCHKMIQDKNATEYMTWMLNRPDYFRVNKYTIQNKDLNRPDISLTVDTANDDEIMKNIFNHFKGEPPQLIDIIKYYDDMPKDIKRKIPLSHLIKSEETINAKFKTDE